MLVQSFDSILTTCIKPYKRTDFHITSDGPFQDTHPPNPILETHKFCTCIMHNPPQVRFLGLVRPLCNCHYSWPVNSRIYEVIYIEFSQFDSQFILKWLRIFSYICINVRTLSSQCAFSPFGWKWWFECETQIKIKKKQMYKMCDNRPV